MIKKLLFSILITFLFVTNIFASSLSISININDNVANIKLSGIDKKIHALQLDIIDENGNLNTVFTPSKNFEYSTIKEKNQNGKTTISIIIDNKVSLTEDGKLNIGTLTFKNKPNLKENVKIELVNLKDNLQGQILDIKANITNNSENGASSSESNTESTTNSSSSNTSTGSAPSGANIGISENKPEMSNQNTNKPNNTNSNITELYPIIRQSNFNDINNHWANNSIKYLADRGIINGMSDNIFAPNNNITRAQFVTLLAKMDNIDINKFKSQNFNDVQADSWFNPYVDWAYKNNITSGINKNNFAPNDNITREQMAVMIERFATYKNFKLDNNKEQINFTDSSNISSYAIESVTRVQKAGIINGKPDGSFAPKDNATRAESAQMIYTMLTIQ